MTETMRDVSFEKNVQVDKIIWLDGLIDTINDHDLFDDYIIPIFDDEKYHESMGIFAEAPYWVKGSDEGVFLEWILEENITGFVVILSTPVPTFMDDSETMHSYTWGRYWTTAIYVTNLEEVPEMATEWRDKMHREEYIRQKSN